MNITNVKANKLLTTCLSKYFTLFSKQDNEKIIIPEGETVIGRGPFLKVRDKQVSRSHAVISLKNGHLQLKPIHSNPTFIYEKSDKSFSALVRNHWRELKDGDSISLLPDSLIFTVINDKEERKCEEQGIGNEPTLEQNNDIKHDESSLEMCNVEDNENALNASLQIDVNIETKELNSSKEVNVQFQSTLEDSIDSIDDQNDEKVAETAVSSCLSKQMEEKSSADAGSSTEAKHPLRTTQGCLKNKKRTLPSWMLASNFSSISNEKKRKTKETNVDKDDDTTGKALSSNEHVKSEISDTTEPFAKKHKAEDEDYKNEDMKSIGESKGESLEADAKEVVDDTQNDNSAASGTGKEDVASSSSKADKDVQSNEEKSTKISQKLPKCQFGKSCYRKNPLHFEAFSHSDGEEESDAEENEKPECPYGTSCYRKNLQHKAEYKHTKPPEDTEPTRRRSTRKPKRKSVLTGDSDDDGENTYDYDDSFIDDAENDDQQSSSYDDDDGDEDFVPDNDSEDLEELIEEANQIKDGK